MKKACFVMILLFLFSICAASGEQLSFSWEIGSGENTETGTAKVLLSENSVVLTSSWLNDYAIMADSSILNGQPHLFFSLPEALQHPDAGSQKLQDILKEWFAGLTSELKYGSFAGDCFDSASVELTRQITWADLSVLLHRIYENTQIMDSGVFEKADSFIREMAALNPFRFRLSNYDNGNVFSLTVIRSGETVATCSVNLSNPQKITAVAGWAENGKDYYLSAEIIPDQDVLEWHAAYLADDASAGYRGLPANALILSFIGEIKNDGEKLLAATDILPANGTGYFSAEWSIGEADAGMKLSYGKDKKLLFAVQAKKEQEKPDELLEGKTILHPDQMTPEEKNTLSGILLGHSIGLLYKLHQILPAEIVTWLLPGM